MTTAKREIHDIQALVKSGFPDLVAARYLLLRFGDRRAGSAWLAGVEVTAALNAEMAELGEVVQVAFTARGLRALGWTDGQLAAFAPEFLDGVASCERKSHRLGDSGPNAPGRWLWGVGEREPDVLIILLARRDQADERLAAITDGALAAGMTVIDTLVSRPAGEPGPTDVEPFGFADGVSQPKIDWDGKVVTSGAHNRDYRNLIAAGEVLLGHANEYGFVADHPEQPPIGRNGSYLVFRQLQQDVTGFWGWLAQRAGSPEGAVALAERMVGRRRDGEALPGLTVVGEDFLFGDDPDGACCPIASHVRRANPRSGDDPNGRRGFLRDLLSTLGFVGEAQADAVASARFHRLLRRGRPYGPILDPLKAMEPGATSEPAGIHFICLNASLARQFEFVQDAWLSSPSFGGRSREQDPLLGNREPLADGSTPDLFRYVDEQGEPRICSGMPRFVTVRGGAYFFLPGLRGLQEILKRGCEAA